MGATLLDARDADASDAAGATAESAAMGASSLIFSSCVASPRPWPTRTTLVISEQPPPSHTSRTYERMSSYRHDFEAMSVSERWLNGSGGSGSARQS